MLRLRIVIPVLNEAPVLEAMLPHWQRLAAVPGVEVVMVDGGSTDGTPQTLAAIAHATLRLIAGPRGRARQMNAGATLPGPHDALLFLHADTVPPGEAVALIRATLHEGPHSWGRFDVRIQGRARMLAVVGRMMNWRSRLSGICTGDQALFMTVAAYEAAGGFPDQPLMEDIEMSSRLKQLSRPACLAAKATTSGRRWDERGVWRTIFLMWRLRWRYWRGASAEHLAQAYR